VNNGLQRTIKSGGIIVGFRKSLGDNISIIETDSKYVLWFKINKNIFRLQQDVLFGIVFSLNIYVKLIQHINTFVTNI
jgi:hypothetical protein